MSYITRRIGSAQIHLADLAEIYPALDLKDLKDVLPVFEVIDKPKHLIQHEDADIGLVLNGSSLKSLQSVTIQTKRVVERTLYCNKLHAGRVEDINVVLEGDITGNTLRKVLQHCAVRNITPSVFAFLDIENDMTIDFSGFSGENARKLCLINERDASKVLSTDQNTLYCPHLTHLILAGLEIQENVLSLLSKAIDQELCQNLTCLSFNTCTGLKGKLKLLFQTSQLSLTHIDLRGTELDSENLETLTTSRNIQLMTLALSQEPETMSLEPLFNQKWKKLTNLTVYNLTQTGCEELGRGIKEGNLPSLRCLRVTMRQDHKASGNLVELKEIQRLLSVSLVLSLGYWGFLESGWSMKKLHLPRMLT